MESLTLCQPAFGLGSWTSLPDEIVVNILAKLPLLHFQRARMVCKSWNQLTHDPSFSLAHGAAAAAMSFRGRQQQLPGFSLFLTSDSSSHLLYLDLNEPSKWRCIPLSFLPHPGGAGFKFFASSDGLLLLGTHNSDLLVVNPITRQFKQLPPSDTIRDPFYTALMADAATGSFVVAIAESELRGEAAMTEIYESKVGKWRSAGKPAKAGKWKRIASSMSTPWFYGSVPVYCKPVYCEGSFYHLAWDPEEMVSELKIKEGVWRSERGAGAVPGGVPWGVMQTKSKVLLLEMSYVEKKSPFPTTPPPPPTTAIATATTTTTTATTPTLALWELLPHTLQWTFKCTIPPPPNHQYSVDKWRRFVVGDGFLCTTFLVPGTIVTFASQSDPQPGMIYDCGNAKWLPMPDLPGIPWGSISSLFSYTPSLQPLS